MQTRKGGTLRIIYGSAFLVETSLLATQREKGASLRLCDDQGTERAAFEIGGLGAPALRVLDEKGELVRDALAPR